MLIWLEGGLVKRSTGQRDDATVSWACGTLRSLYYSDLKGCDMDVRTAGKIGVIAANEIVSLGITAVTLNGMMAFQNAQNPLNQPKTDSIRGAISGDRQLIGKVYVVRVHRFAKKTAWLEVWGEATRRSGDKVPSTR